MLAIYDGSRESSADQTRIHKWLELPLNHLGFRLEYRNVEEMFAERDSSRQDIVFAVSWFDAQVPNTLQWERWLDQFGEGRLRIAVIGETGFPETHDLLLSRLGLRLEGRIPVTIATEFRLFDPDIAFFERRPDAVVPPFSVLKATNSSVDPLLGIHDRRSAITSLLAVSGPNGAYAIDDFALSTEPVTGTSQWLIDPIRFLELAYDLPLRPVPDVTTVNGRRILISHIDGDGWNNRSHVKLLDNPTPTAAEVLRERLIKPFPGMPVTVGIIAGDMDPALGGDGRAVESARKIFALPQVDAGVHTYTHPFVWEVFAGGNADDEMAWAINHRTTLPPWRRIAIALRDKLRQATGVYRGPISSEVVRLPRYYAKNPFDLERETTDAIAAVNAIAPADRPAPLYQWSGDALPFEAAVASVSRSGVAAINGGDSRMDRVYPSMSHLSAIARPVGKERQIYAIDGNDYLFTNGWKANYASVGRIRETFERSDLPRRLKGIDIYYHAFLGEREAAVGSMEQLIAEMLADDTIPVRAADYVRIAEGFFSTEITALGSRRWQITNRGELQTLRFDHASGWKVDWDESTGVLGQKQINGSLYVHLDPLVTTPVIAVTRKRDSVASSLTNARWNVRGLTRNECGMEMLASGFGAGAMTWAGMRNGKYHITAKRDGLTVWTGDPIASNQVLEFQIEADAINPLHIRIDCEHAAL
ncbi:hypothetical protein OEG84_17195 [Hoeflea sp. G2-23]|uniref:Polysaccharide deacetylase n=1 Tax=Hoeflea algicola TaxID=2983763 RepID=A0ABT3ZCD0_9HYPH|nr:hypothetical protein [Hoeflea algicola]MCY0149399.1 hypothetical protein [Hoeflea algicola]